MSIVVKLPDGRELPFEHQPTALEVAETISKGLARNAVAAQVDGKVRDLASRVPDRAAVRILTEKDKEALEVLRHSTAHLMAMAVRNLWPDTQYTIGPVIEDGFYYDFDLGHVITDEDLPKIEAEMEKLAKQAIPYVRTEKPRAEAAACMAQARQHYKVEIIRDLADEAAFSFYNNGDFVDLCRGPHLPHTGWIKSFKLQKVAGAYWRGKSDNKMLQRVYGTAFFNKKELDEHLHLLEEARKRDHRKLGKEMELFSFHEEGPGFPFYLPKGTAVIDVLQSYMKSMYQREGYQYVRTPLMLNVEMWHRSGHYDNYREAMYFAATEEAQLAVKPMNCPGHCLIFSEGRRSYRELPMRIAEFGTVHRYELSGVAEGLKRARGFTQDDAHIFCTEEQIEGEISSLIRLVQRTYRDFGFQEYTINLATRPARSVGSEEAWSKAEAALHQALKTLGLEYVLRPGDGAFYGPKIDIDIRDALKRSFTISTIQVDFNFPERLDLKYVAADGSMKRPVLIHRAIAGSFDRTLAILIEHYGGLFPLWLAPEQVRVLNITDDQAEYVQGVSQKLRELGYRVQADVRNEKIGLKIREATLQKVPYMLVCGPAETAAGTVAVRERKQGDLGAKPLAEFIQLLAERMQRKD